MEPSFSMELLDREASMFANLKLLGFNERKYALALAPGLFMHSNPTAGDKIFHFLFSLLRPDEDFRGIWPCKKSAEASAFRKVVHGFVYELENVGAIPKSNSSRSTLANCHGDRFVKLLYHLSRHALQVDYEALPSASLPSNDFDAPNMDVLPEEDQLMHLHGMAVQKFLELNKEGARKQKQWRVLSEDITNEYHLLTEREEFLKLQLEKLSAARPLSRDKLQIVKQNLKARMEYTDSCRELASGAAYDVIKEDSHRFSIRGDRVHVHKRNAVSEDAGPSTLRESRDKTFMKGVKNVEDTPKRKGSGGLERADGMEDAQSDDILSWGNMFHNLRTSIESPVSLRSSGREHADVDLVEVVKGLVEELEYVMKPSTNVQASSQENLHSFLQKTSGGLEAMNAHSQHLEPLDRQYKLHLADAQELRRNIRAELEQAEGTIEELYVQIDSKNQRDEQPSNTGEGKAPFHTPGLSLTLVPPTPAEKPLDPIDNSKSFSILSKEGRVGEENGLDEEERDVLWPPIAWEEDDPEEFKAVLERFRESVRMEALKKKVLREEGESESVEQDAGLERHDGAVESTSVVFTLPALEKAHDAPSARRDSILLIEDTCGFDLLGDGGADQQYIENLRSPAQFS